MSDNARRIRRRDFLKVTGAGIALAGVSGAAMGEPTTQPSTRPAKASSGNTPKRVIFFVSDGMSWGVPSLTEHFSHVARNGRGTVLEKMLKDPKVAHGFFETHSLDSLVTDSAAASCTWGSGSRILNNFVNMYPDGTKLKPILHLVKESGRGTGLVTTTTATHATPAGWASNVEGRWMQRDIAPQYINHVDVVMGGGKPFFDPEERPDNRDVVSEYKQAGYAHIENLEGLKKLDTGKTDKVLGLFANGHLPYTLDHMNDEEIKKTVPTLAEMTKAALEILDRNPNGFLMQVEGGRVDHAGHANDGAAIYWDQIAFDDAVAVALEYAKERPDTLVVVTTDHGTGGPQLNGWGSSYRDSTPFFESLAACKASYEVLQQDISGIRREKDEIDAQTMGDLLHRKLAIQITDEEAAHLAQAANGEIPLEFNHALRSFNGILGQVLGNYTAMGWTSTNHTAEFALLAAVGPGQEAFDKLIKNTDAFHIMTGFFGISHVNPTMTLEEALRHQASVPTQKYEDWA